MAKSIPSLCIKIFIVLPTAISLFLGLSNEHPQRKQSIDFWTSLKNSKSCYDELGIMFHLKKDLSIFEKKFIGDKKLVTSAEHEQIKDKIREQLKANKTKAEHYAHDLIQTFKVLDGYIDRLKQICHEIQIGKLEKIPSEFENELSGKKTGILRMVNIGMRAQGLEPKEWKPIPWDVNSLLSMVKKDKNTTTVL